MDALDVVPVILQRDIGICQIPAILNNTPTAKPFFIQECFCRLGSTPQNKISWGII